MSMAFLMRAQEVAVLVLLSGTTELKCNCQLGDLSRLGVLRMRQKHWKEGLTLVADRGMHKVVLETDCSSTATVLARKRGDRSPLKFIIDEALAAGDRLSEWTVVYKIRESSSVAHKLAQLEKRSRESAVWQFAAPVCVEQIIARGCTCAFE
jgi:hypothetical protein